MKKKIFSLWIAVLASIMGLHGAALAGPILDKVLKNKVLVAAYSPGWPPVAYLDDQNQLVGFDVDVGKEIARRLGVKLEIVTVSWEFIEAGRWGGRWDIAIGSMTPTVPRAQVLDFPAVYWYTPGSFAVHADNKNIRTLADLQNKKIGVCGGCSTEDYMKGALKFAIDGGSPVVFQVKINQLRSYDSEGGYLDDLKLGNGVRLDAVLSNLPTLLEAAKTQPLRIISPPAFFEPLAIAIDKGDPEFSAKIAEIIRDMHQDGTLTDLSKKWFNGQDWTKPQ